MNKIYKIHHNENPKETVALGLLIDELNDEYIFQIDSKKESYSKKEFTIESIYEPDSEKYQIETKTSENETVFVDLTKICFGGCG